MAQRSLYGLYNTVSLGVDGTSMKGFGELTDDERWSLAFYVDKLGAAGGRADQVEALWRKGVGKKEVGSLHTVATLNEVEIATLLPVVFTGHGVQALQEAGVMPASPLDMTGFRSLGVYATVETTLAQIVVLVLVVGAFVVTRAANRRRSVLG
jgi:hypothetical protein